MAEIEELNVQEEKLMNLERRLVDLQAQAFRLICGRDRINEQINQTVMQINQLQELIKNNKENVDADIEKRS
jgi:hypothetical protein